MGSHMLVAAAELGAFGTQIQRMAFHRGIREARSAHSRGWRRRRAKADLPGA